LGLGVRALLAALGIGQATLAPGPSDVANADRVKPDSSNEAVNAYP
jgi:hypothetical protein